MCLSWWSLGGAGEAAGVIAGEVAVLVPGEPVLENVWRDTAPFWREFPDVGESTTTLSCCGSLRLRGVPEP